MEQARAINRYVCQDCGQATTTVNRHDGVTPFLIRCKRPGCAGMAQSSFYRVVQAAVPTGEWYRPEAAEFAKLDPDVREHVARGGLLLRPIGGPTKRPAGDGASRALAARLDRIARNLAGAKRRKGRRAGGKRA